MSHQTLPRVKEVECLDGHRVRIQFTDSTSAEIDLGPYLLGPIFKEIRKDSTRFQELKVDPELRTIVWPNGADIDPDVLYNEIPVEELENRPPHL